MHFNWYSRIIPWGIITVILVQSSFALDYQLRLGYVIPSNRTSQTNAVANLQNYIPTMQNWYADQMDRYGFGRKTFNFETLGDDVTPFVHTVGTSMTDATIRNDIWGNTGTAASNAGLSIWSPGQVWLLVPEAHLEQSDGTIIGGTALGASFGSGSDPGVAMGGSDFLPRLNPSWLTNTQAYAGQTISQFGPYPLVQDKSFPWFEGTTLSSIASSAQGAIAHELGHAFGLGHDFRNDSNFNGDLMGNGLRGWRGSIYPSLFPNDDAQLSYAAALALSVSRYFNPSAVYTDESKPALNISTSGAVNPVNGQLQVHFSGSDSSGLVAALLRRNGDLVAESHLNGTNLNDFVLSTPYYTPGQNDQFTVDLYDAQGNKQSAQVNITVNTGFNQAPQPFLNLRTSVAKLNKNLLLDASPSSDPNDSAGTLRFEWDLNGDGIFEIGPSQTSTLTTSFNSSGNRLIYVRVTDPHGAMSVSEPLSLQVVPISSIWTLNTNGKWFTTSNWIGDVPSGLGAKASFTGATPAVVIVDSPVTVGQILLDAGTATTNYTLSGSAITLNNLGGIGNGALINVVSGSHTISAPLFLNDNASIAGSGILNLTGGVMGNYTLSIFSNITAKSIQVDTLIIGSAGALQAVPEPSSIALFGIGVVGLLSFAWRRRKA